MNPNVIELVYKHNKLSKDIDYLWSTIKCPDFKTTVADAEILMEQLEHMTGYLKCMHDRLMLLGVDEDCLRKCVSVKQ